MSAVLTRPPAAPPAAGPARPRPASEGLAIVAVIAVVIAACLPLARVFVGLDFLRPVLAAALLSVGISAVSRRLGAGPGTTFVATSLGLLAFTGVAFLSETLVMGFLPTLATVQEAQALWIRGVELIRVRPAPTFAEASLLMLTVSGVWAVAYCVEGLVFRLRSPVKAVLMAMILWVVPLAMAPTVGGWPWAVPFLGASALLLLASAGHDLSRWGTWVEHEAAVHSWRPSAHPLAPTGTLLATLAILAGVVLAGTLPGFGEDAWYEVRGLGGSTLTSNPMVTIRGDLVSPDDRPLLRVRTTRPVYLRLTSLDRYSAREEWTNDGIRGGSVSRRTIPFEEQIAQAQSARVEVTVQGLDSAVLVPLPYQTTAVDGPVTASFQYDRSLSTFTMEGGTTLQSGDTYQAVAAVPKPDPAAALAVDNRAPGDPLTALPANVPESVADLAREIVAAAGAQTPFEQAMAIQEELQSWTYSLDPPQGHGGTAMESFITNRVGYCEQYAGTMAVMLRTLDIPARVGVGFSPGSLLGESAGPDGRTVREYEITQSNAHAWVEVLFPGLGWVTFEPTPRDDGNVLVPSPAELAPGRTTAELAGEPRVDDGSALPPSDEDFIPRQNEQAAGGLDEGADDAAAAPGGPGGRGGWLLAVAGVAAVLALGAGLLGTRRAHDPARPPALRIHHARQRTARLARGLGAGPADWETEAEWLGRLAPGVPAASVLADRSAEARYAPAVGAEAADDAERAAGQLERRLLGDLPAHRRPVVRVRGEMATHLAGARRLLSKAR